MVERATPPPPRPSRGRSGDQDAPPGPGPRDAASADPARPRAPGTHDRHPRPPQAATNGRLAGAGRPVVAPARQASLREHNLALLLQQVAASPEPVSRAGLAAVTGLTRATVSALAEELIGGGLLGEVQPTPRTGAGRPAIGLRLSAQGPAGLGLEVNVDHLAACLVDLTGQVRHYAVRHGDQRSPTPDRVLRRLAGLAAEALDVAGAEGLSVAGAALAVPGLVADSGVVRLAPNLGWRDLDLPAVLARTAGFPDLPVTVDNEANLAALGELRASPARDFIYVSGEVGIGAGVVLDGRLFRGARGFSGELGHLTIRPDGPACGCGARGCLEQYAGQEAILRAAAIAGTAPADGAARIVSAARAGESGMLDALRSAGTALGVATAGVVNLLDVDTVVLGGCYAPAAPWLRGPVERELRSRVVTSGWAPVTVRASALGPRATVVGAAGVAVHAVLEAPARWLSR